MSNYSKFTDKELCQGLNDLMESIDTDDAKELLKEAIYRLGLKRSVPFNDEAFNV